MRRNGGRREGNGPFYAQPCPLPSGWLFPAPLSVEDSEELRPCGLGTEIHAGAQAASPGSKATTELGGCLIERSSNHTAS